VQGGFALGHVISDKALVAKGFAQSGGKRLVVFDEKDLHSTSLSPNQPPGTL
jgi:hypothetical protein